MAKIQELKKQPSSEQRKDTKRKLFCLEQQYNKMLECCQQDPCYALDPVRKKIESESRKSEPDGDYIEYLREMEKELDKRCQRVGYYQDLDHLQFYMLAGIHTVC